MLQSQPFTRYALAIGYRLESDESLELEVHSIRRSACPFLIALSSIVFAQQVIADQFAEDALRALSLSVSFTQNPDPRAATERRLMRLEHSLEEANKIRRGDLPIEGILREQVIYLTQAGLAAEDAERIVTDAHIELIECRIGNPADDQQCIATTRQQAGLAGFVPEERNRCDDGVRLPNLSLPSGAACSLTEPDTEE